MNLNISKLKSILKYLNSLPIIILLIVQIGRAFQSYPKKIRIFWGLLGSYPQEKQWNPYKLTRDDKNLDVGSILYTIRKEYKNIEDISLATNIAAEKIEHKLEELKQCELVKKKGTKFIVNFPFWDAALRDTINALGAQLANQIVELLKTEIPKLKAILDESSLPSQGYKWNDVALTIIGGFLLDTGLNDRGLRKWKVFDQKRDTPIRPGNYRYWYKAVEGGWGKYWKFGHDQQTNHSVDVWFGLFYGQIPAVRRMNWSKAWDVHDKQTKQVIFPLIKNGKINKNELQKQLTLSTDSLNKILQKMEIAKVVRMEESFIYPNFPIFDEDDIQGLLSKIDMICDQVIEEIYIPFLPRIEETWQKIAPANWEIQNIDKFFIREVYDRPYNLTLDILIREGIIPPAPVEPPFNYWGINGHFKLL